MKTIKLFVIASALACLAGCEITGPSVRVEPPKVKVDGVKVENGTNNSSNNNGKFCPPGQAKKGNC